MRDHGYRATMAICFGWNRSQIIRCERAEGLFEQKVAIKMMYAGFSEPDARRGFDAERRFFVRDPKRVRGDAAKRC